MNAATCAVLAGVFPLVLIAIVADRRELHLNLRRRRWYRRIVTGTISACLFGLGYAVVGVQLDGYTLMLSVTLWGLFVVALLGFAASITLRLATQENEEDEAGKELTAPA